MSFIEQLCQFDVEDLPEIKWLETILKEKKPDRTEVCGFIVKLEAEIAERRQRLLELELEIKKQSKRLDFAVDCKECLNRYATSISKPAVPPRSNSMRQATVPESNITPSPSEVSQPEPFSNTSTVENEGDYAKLSDCYSSRPFDMTKSRSPVLRRGVKLASGTKTYSPADVKLRTKEKATLQSALEKRHTLDDEKIEQHVRQADSFGSSSSNSPKNGQTQPQEYVNLNENGSKNGHAAMPSSYVNMDQYPSATCNNSPTPHQVTRGGSMLSFSTSTEALIDEQFGFLDKESTADAASIVDRVELAQRNGGEHSTLVEPILTRLPRAGNHLIEERKKLIAGFISDQKDYVGIIETVLKYSLAIKSTLNSAKPDIINSSDFTCIFGLLPRLCEIEKAFVSSLEERMKAWSPSDSFFLPFIGEKYDERISLYGQYLRRYDDILDTVRRCLRESQKFNETCSEIIVNDRKQGKVKRRLDDVILMPIVRLQATGLALERIIEVTPAGHPDHAILIAFRKKLRTSLDAPDIVPMREGGAGSSEKTLTGQKRQVLRPAVALVEWVTQPTSKLITLTVDSVRKLRYTFLFTDVFVACKRRAARNSRFHFEAVWWFPVSDLKLEDLPPVKVDQAVKAKLEELSHDILLIRRNLLATSRGDANHSASATQEQRKKLMQLEEAWLTVAPLVPLRLYNAESGSGKSGSSNDGKVGTTSESKLILFLSDFELGDWKRAIHACQMRLMSASSSPVHFTKEFLTLLCNDVAEKMGLSNSANISPKIGQHQHYPQMVVNPAEQLYPMSSAAQATVFSDNSHSAAAPMSNIVASSSTGGVNLISTDDGLVCSLGQHLLSGQLFVTIHELTGLSVARPCSIVLFVDQFGHFHKQAQTRLSEASICPRWVEEFELDLSNSSTMRVVCYQREPSGRDMIIGQSALQLTPDWLAKPFVVQPIGLLAAASTDPHLSLTVTIRYRSPQMTLRRRDGLPGKGVSSMFGQALSDVVSRERSETGIPRIVTECVRRIEASDGLDQEGLYRISGLVSEVKRMKAAFDKDISNAREQLHNSDVNVATGVVKSFFRELPDPLFTETLSPDCFQLVADTRQSTVEPGELMDDAASVFERLPKANRKTACFLLQHLCRVAARCDKNLMTADNLAKIWGATLISPPANSNMSAAAASTIFLQGQVLLVFLQLISSGYKIPDS